MSKYDMARDRPDDFQTNPWALDVLMPHLNSEWTVWECAAGKGNLVHGLCERGQERVIASDILPTERIGGVMRWQRNFVEDLAYQFGFDMILTNPPYTLKDEFLARCYEIGKPFALLLPLTALEGQVRQRLYKEHGLEIVFLPKRPEFETPSGKNSGSWFAAAWFTNGLNIGQQLTFNPPTGGAARSRVVEAQARLPL